MKKIKISIIIPTLNEEVFLPKLLQSLSNQTDTDFEVVVTDGKSKDNTILKANTFKDKINKLKIITCDHASLPYQRNRGADVADGDLLIFSDADNFFLPYAISRMREYITVHEPSFFTTWFSPDTDVRSEVILTVLGNLLIEGSILLKRSFSPGPLTVVTREVFKKVNGYNESASWGEDMDFAQRVVKSGYHLDIIRETLYVWSMRRFRKEGTMKVLQKFAKASLYVLLTKRTLTKMDGYEMGGHLYTKRTKIIKPSVLKTIDSRLKRLLREFFE